MPRGIEIGDKARDAVGVLWEHTVADIGERWCVGARPVSRMVDGLEYDRAAVEAAIVLAPPFGSRFDQSRTRQEALLGQWSWESLRWFERTTWMEMDRLPREEEVPVVPEAAIVGCGSCGATAKIRTGDRVQIDPVCGPGHIKVIQGMGTDVD